MTEIQAYDPGAIMEQVIMKGDLAALKPQERADYYAAVCKSMGLNPLTKPFEYLSLNGKLVLYAGKNCAEQLREHKKVSVQIVAREVISGTYVVTSRATLPDGRVDESIGAVPIEIEQGEWVNGQGGRRAFQSNGEWKPLRGEALSNAMMKAETKSKRRVTLSIVGLGMLDESEIESIPNAKPFVEIEPAQPRQQKPIPQGSEIVTPLQLRRLHTLGKEIYGDGWDAKRPELVKAVTRRRATSSKELTSEEAASLLEGLEYKAREKEADSHEVPAEVTEDITDLAGEPRITICEECKTAEASTEVNGKALCAVCAERTTIATDMAAKRGKPKAA